MIELSELFKILNDYEDTSNINKKKEILKVLLDNFTKYKNNIDDMNTKLLKEERDLLNEN